MKESIHMISALMVVLFTIVLTVGFFVSSVTLIVLGGIGFAVSFLVNMATDDNSSTGLDGGCEYGGW